MRGCSPESPCPCPTSRSCRPARGRFRPGPRRSEPPNVADARRTAAGAEAAAIREINRAAQEAQSNPLLLQLKSLEVEKARVEKLGRTLSPNVAGGRRGGWPHGRAPVAVSVGRQVNRPQPVGDPVGRIHTVDSVIRRRLPWLRFIVVKHGRRRGRNVFPGQPHFASWRGKR